jgi:SAM-dependent methyltransferase
MEDREYLLIDRVEDTMWWFHAQRALMTETLRRHMADGHGPILDAGCGTGGMTRYLRAAFPRAATFGIDINPAAASRAREKSGSAVATGSVNGLPFREGAFAGMISGDIFYHKAVDPAAAAREAFRCLRPGGVFVITVPAYAWLSSAHDERVHAARRYTRCSLAAVLKDAGFQVPYMTYWNTLLFPLMVLRRKVFVPANQESDLKDFPPLLDRIFRGVMAVELALLRTGLPLPFGGSVLAVGRKPE